MIETRTRAPQMKMMHLGLALLCAVVALGGVNRLIDGTASRGDFAVALVMAVVGAIVGVLNLRALWHTRASDG